MFRQYFHKIKVQCAIGEYFFESNFIYWIVSFYWKIRINFARENHYREEPFSVNLEIYNFIIFFPRFVGAEIGGKKSHLFDNFSYSASNFGLGCQSIEADSGMYGNTEDKNISINKLRSLFRSNKSNVVLFDANHIPENELEELSREDFIELRNQFTFIGCVFDYYQGQPDRISYWLEVCDLLVLFTPSLTSKVTQQWVGHKKIIIFPFTPQDRDQKLIPKYTPEKFLDFFYDGSAARHRDIFMSKLKPSSRIQKSFHKNSDPTSTSHFDYLEAMSNSIATFTNGFTVSGEHIITDRIKEALSVGTIPIAEYSKSLNFFLRPYIHYFPVRNRYGVWLALKFLTRNLDFTERFVLRAHSSLERSYGDYIFWSNLIKKINSIKTY